MILKLLTVAKSRKRLAK